MARQNIQQMSFSHPFTGEPFSDLLEGGLQDVATVQVDGVNNSLTHQSHAF